MERNFTHENFEEFLQRNSDSLRMRPSEKVWKNIASGLSKRRRYGFLSVFLLLTLLSVGYFIDQSDSSKKPTLTTSHRAAVQKSTPAIHAGASTPSKQVSALVPESIPHTYSATIPSGASERENAFTRRLFENVPWMAMAPVQQDIVNEEPLAFTPTIADEYDPHGSAENKSSNAPETANAATDPLSIESVVNSYHRPFKKGKLGLQLIFSPTISYRKLGENKAFLSQVPQFNAPYNMAALYNVNDIVTSKPNVGFELGLSGKYPLTSKVNLIGGLQFNVNRYDLKVFQSYMNIATIALNTGRTVDSVRTLTNYSSTNRGYGSDWLHNFYFQVSAPVGMEFKLRGDEKMQFGVATTIQPTYVLGDRVYLISTDYKNYAEVPWLTRHWNVNTNLETFVSYSTGHFKWQVGPQVRYQLLSSFINKYPVKEHLFDFGLKVGISLNHY
jgi:hypothetical protein